MTRYDTVPIVYALVIVLAGALVFVSLATAQQKGVLTATAKVYPKTGNEAEVEAILLKMMEAVRKAEPDCFIYRPHRSTKDPTVFLWYEQYRTDAAYEFHRTAPHLVEYRKQLGTLIGKPPEVDLYRSLAE